MMRFIGRRRELELIRKELSLPRPSLIVAYGRRRVGKSRLLREAVDGTNEIYFQATRVSSTLNLEAFKAETARVLGSDPVIQSIESWEGILHYVANAAENSRKGLAVIIDEFPFVIDQDSSLPSVIQKFWDSGAPRKGSLKLILCGSAIAQMEELLAERNPLYGRKTMTLEVKQLPLRDAALFFPGYDSRQAIEAYGIFGGIPHYLQLCDPDKDIRQNVVDLLLTETGALVDEPTTLLQTELRDPGTYSSILAAIADGCTTSSEIAGRLRSDSSSLPPYIQRLSKLDLVNVNKSLDATEKERNRRYSLNDPLIAFWHHFVRSNLSAINSGFGERVYEDVIEPRLSEFMGPAFERICLDHARLYAQESVGSPAMEIGSIWGHAEFDIDVAGRTLGGSFFYGECKWQTKQIDLSVVEKLRLRSERTVYGVGKTGKNYLLFSRSGYRPEVNELAKTDTSIHLLELDDLARYPSREPALHP
ncbi:ATP-binding protein [Mesorhizobium sp.]|uniref:ATP-binding protein n=1 Tax=Mesorhizobium sp. TaxID=1871066 RepID=UPI00345D32B3